MFSPLRLIVLLMAANLALGGMTLLSMDVLAARGYEPVPAITSVAKVFSSPGFWVEEPRCYSPMVPANCLRHAVVRSPLGQHVLCDCVWPGWVVATTCLSMLTVFLMLSRELRLWTRATNGLLFLRASNVSSLVLSVLFRISKQPRLKSRSVRSQFMSLPAVKNSVARNHTHGKSAASRSRASSEMVLLAQSLGTQAYFLQQSASDQKLGRSGSREYFWAKDLNADRVPECQRDFSAIVDVDYYLDMPELLAGANGPVCLYTFVPTAAASDSGEFSFSFDADSWVSYRVSGGGRYSHALWDYGTDVLIAETSYFWGLWRVGVAYNVDRRQIDAHHQSVLLTPISRTSCPLLPMSLFVKGDVLKRLSVVESVDTPGGTEKFVRLAVQTASGLSVSTGKVNSHVCATIPKSADDGLSITSTNGKVDLSSSQVQTQTGIADKAQAALLTQYHRFAYPHAPATVYPVSESVVAFAYDPRNHDYDAAPALSAFMSPLVLGAVVPSACEGNDTQAIKGRLEAVKSPEFKIDARMVGWIEEFARLLVPERELGVAFPVDQDFIYDKQARPAQRNILDAAVSMGGFSSQPVNSFMKKESYSKVTDPRNISQIPPQNKLKHSGYIYTFSQLMRKQDWYAFGRSPRLIADRVAEVCAAAKKVTKTDLSRCDGRISNIFRHLERTVMLRHFHESVHNDLVECLNTQHSQRAFTRTGYEYETGFSRLSGSPETADFNSMDNAFIAFVTFRRMGFSPQEAYAKLGIYGGDDGLTADADDSLYTETAAMLGQVLEAESVSRFSRGVDFLARLYSPNVWTGSLDSMCDVRRQLLKFHLTGNLPPNITPMMKLREKLRGFSYTDGQTPIISEMIHALSKGKGLMDEQDPLLIGSNVASYWATTCDSFAEQFPNEDSAGGWMEYEIQLQMPDFDYTLFERWMKKCWSKPEAMLSPPVMADCTAVVAVKEAVVVGGELVMPKGKGLEIKKEACLHYLAGRCTYGANCRGSHEGNIPQDNAVCNMFQKGKCPFGANCKWPHVSRGASPSGGPQ